MNRARSCLAAVLALAQLATATSGCGGGGGDGGGGQPPPPPVLAISTAVLAAGVVDVAYNQTVAATGGTGARSFSISAGALPAGLLLNGQSGVISGTPAGPAGTADFTVTVEDSGSPPQSDSQNLSIVINAAVVGRNDTIGTATPLGNGTHAASISPSGHPNTLLDADEDFYEITTTTASTVTVDINAQSLGSPLDAVIEILAANGTRLNTCVAPLFDSPCVHDDEDPGVSLDSLLQIQVGAATTFYVHVVDWSSNARPDKTYDLVISGVN